MIGSYFLPALVIASLVRTGSAVDRSKFRTCEQGSFCRRFKTWVARPERETALWKVLPSTRENVPEGGGVSYKVKHVAESEPHLLLKLNAYAKGMIRMRLNEIDPLHKRHEIPAGDAITDPGPTPAATVDIKDGGDSTTLTWVTSDGQDVKAELQHASLKLDVTVGGVLVQRLNARNSLNFERYRQPKADLPPDSTSASLSGPVTLDAAYHPHNLDKNGLWEEDFGGHTDKKPRGPASLGMDVTFVGDVPGLFGLPEHMTKVSLPFYDEPYRFFNLDVFEYENDEPMALYGAVPILWAVHRGESRHVTSAFLWINPSETFVKLERDEGKVNSGPAHSWWTSESGVLDVVVMVGPSPQAVSGQFHGLTGLAPLPPLWALGKHQCRWNYMTEKDVAAVDTSYDKYDIPYDVIWLDIEHTDGKAYFTWNNAAFPTPDKMMDSISAKRRKFVNVVDPHIKKQDSFHVYTEIRDKGFFTKKIDWKTLDDPTDAKPEDFDRPEKIADPEATQPDVWNEAEDGKWVAPQIDNPEYKGEWKARQITDPNSPISDFEGWCWPGTSLYPDFTDPAMREYWGSQFALDKYKGTNADLYVWNDMNEPSVFNGPEVTMPRDAIHPNGNVEHRDVHNMYGYYVHRATFEGLGRRVPGDRPFVLTRSFFIGSHKYAAIWTGDNYAKWEHLQASIAMLGALALGGQSLVGADVGGFFKHPDAEMVTRWYQLAVLAYPFLRNHAHLETPRREPYMYDEATMLRVRASLQLRYRMLPLWYNLFRAYATLGEPVIRPLWWDFIEDPNTHSDTSAVENQIMLGSGVLVHGVAKPMDEGGDKAEVYLPRCAGWYDLYTGDFFAPGRYDQAVTLESIPAFHRAGTIVPLKSRVRRSSACMSADPYTLNVYLDPTTGAAAGSLYIDDYRTLNYTDGQSFLDIRFTFAGSSLTAAKTGGMLPREVSAEVERLEIFGLTKPVEFVNVGGTQMTAVSRKIKTNVPGEGIAPNDMYVAMVKVKPWLDLRADGWNAILA